MDCLNIAPYRGCILRDIVNPRVRIVTHYSISLILDGFAHETRGEIIRELLVYDSRYFLGDR